MRYLNEMKILNVMWLSIISKVWNGKLLEKKEISLKLNKKTLLRNNRRHKSGLVWFGVILCSNVTRISQKHAFGKKGTELKLFAQSIGWSIDLKKNLKNLEILKICVLCDYYDHNSFFKLTWSAKSKKNMHRKSF